MKIYIFRSKQDECEQRKERRKNSSKWKKEKNCFAFQAN